MKTTLSKKQLISELLAMHIENAKLRQELDEAHAALAEFVIIADSISTIVGEAK